ncbi:MAG: hypothetical protein IPO28_13550 [Holophagaceae bacterium]|nr:hypothetical protein [Holophagaceae bacterium]
MTGLRLLGLLIQDVLRDLLRHRGQYLLAVLTLASGLLLAGGGLLLVESLDRFVGRLEGMAKVVAYAAEGRSLDETAGRLQRDPRFREVRRMSAEENRRRFLSATREAGLLLESAGQDALPESLELTLRQDLASGGKAVEVGESLRGMPGVGDVLVDQERLENLQRMARMLRSALATLGTVLLLAAGFATGNVIRMSILAREEEITIMRLVGASESFIRTPLLLEGAFLGLVGACLAPARALRPLAAAVAGRGRPVAPPRGAGAPGLLLLGQHAPAGLRGGGHRRPGRPLGLLGHPQGPARGGGAHGRGRLKPGRLPS